MVLGFSRKHVFFSVCGWEFSLSTAWKQGSSNGDAVVFDNIKTIMSFYSI
jgi:hypothetical protein